MKQMQFKMLPQLFISPPSPPPRTNKPSFLTRSANFDYKLSKVLMSVWHFLWIPGYSDILHTFYDISSVNSWNAIFLFVALHVICTWVSLLSDPPYVEWFYGTYFFNVLIFFVHFNVTIFHVLINYVFFFKFCFMVSFIWNACMYVFMAEVLQCERNVFKNFICRFP